MQTYMYDAGLKVNEPISDSILDPLLHPDGRPFSCKVPEATASERRPRPAQQCVRRSPADRQRQLPSPVTSDAPCEERDHVNVVLEFFENPLVSLVNRRICMVRF